MHRRSHLHNPLTGESTDNSTTVLAILRVLRRAKERLRAYDGRSKDD